MYLKDQILKSTLLSLLIIFLIGCNHNNFALEEKTTYPTYSYNHQHLIENNPEKIFINLNGDIKSMFIEHWDSLRINNEVVDSYLKSKSDILYEFDSSKRVKIVSSFKHDSVLINKIYYKNYSTNSILGEVEYSYDELRDSIQYLYDNKDVLTGYYDLIRNKLTEFEVSTKNDTTIIYDRNRSRVKYYINGKLVKQENDKVLYKTIGYYPSGNMQTITCYNKNGSIQFANLFNKSGKQVIHYPYRVSGKNNSKNIKVFHYDSLETNIYNYLSHGLDYNLYNFHYANDMLVEGHYPDKIEYDEHENIILFETEKFRSTYQYEYDTSGNWTKRTKYLNGRFSGLTKRIFQYFSMLDQQEKTKDKDQFPNIKLEMPKPKLEDQQAILKSNFKNSTDYLIGLWAQYLTGDIQVGTGDIKNTSSWNSIPRVFSFDDSTYETLYYNYKDGSYELEKENYSLDTSENTITMSSPDWAWKMYAEDLSHFHIVRHPQRLIESFKKIKRYGLGSRKKDINEFLNNRSHYLYDTSYVECNNLGKRKVDFHSSGTAIIQPACKRKDYNHINTHWWQLLDTIVHGELFLTLGRDENYIHLTDFKDGVLKGIRYDLVNNFVHLEENENRFCSKKDFEDLWYAHRLSTKIGTIDFELPFIKIITKQNVEFTYELSYGPNYDYMEILSKENRSGYIQIINLDKNSMNLHLRLPNQESEIIEMWRQDFDLDN